VINLLLGSCPLAVFCRQQHSSSHAIESHSATGGGPILGSRRGAGERASEPSIATEKRPKSAMFDSIEITKDAL
jgi:hypothetical protein